MSDRKYLKPGEGRTVRDELSGESWPAEGDWADNTRFIRRRITDGDLVETDPPKASEAEPAQAAEAGSAPTADVDLPKAVKAAKAEK